MIELPLVLMSGLLGSAHCLGMCGGFALAIGGGATNVRSNLARQLVYTAGRVFTYMVFGHPEGGLEGIAPAVDGVIGEQLSRLASRLGGN